MEFDTDNGMDALMAGCTALLLTVVVVHAVSLRPYISPSFEAGSSEILGESTYWNSYWARIAESGDGRKQIHGSAFISDAFQELNYFGFQIVA